MDETESLPSYRFAKYYEIESYGRWRMPNQLALKWKSVISNMYYSRVTTAVKVTFRPKAALPFNR